MPYIRILKYDNVWLVNLTIFIFKLKMEAIEMHFLIPEREEKDIIQRVKKICAVDGEGAIAENKLWLA